MDTAEADWDCKGALTLEATGQRDVTLEKDMRWWPPLEPLPTCIISLKRKAYFTLCEVFFPMQSSILLAPVLLS